MNIGELIATLGVDSHQLDTALKDFQGFEKKVNDSVSRINTKLGSIGKQMENVGKNMTKYLTLPLTAVGVGAFKLHKDFETSLTKIVGLVGIARGQVDEWGRDILELAPKVAKPPAELADALFFVTSAGIRGAEAMQVLEMSAKASAAGLGETKVVADLVTSAMNAYGIANLSAQQATDVLVKAVREGKAEAPALATSMGMVLPIASAMGVSFDQVGAAVAAMTRTGTNAQTAAVQLRQILASLLKPTTQAKEALIGMGTSAEEFRSIVREQGVLAALMKLRDLTKQYGEETMSTVMPNIRALSGVLDLMGSNLEDNKKIFESLADSTGTLDSAFMEVTGDVDFKFKRALSTAQITLIELGDAMKADVIKVFEGFSKTLSKVITWFKNLSSEQKQLVTRIGAVVAIAGPLLTVLGFLMTNILPGLVTAGGAAIKMLNAMRIAMISNPFTAAAVAIGLVVTALVLMKNRAEEAAAAQKALDSVNKIANSNIAEQKVRIDQLYRIAQSENASLNQRKAALEELNKISPKYFGNLNLETINTKKATDAKQAYIQELLREAKVRAAQEKLIELEKRAMDELVMGEAKRLTLGQNFIAGALVNIGAFGNAAIYANEKAGENFNKTKNEINTTRDALQSFIDSLLTVEDVSNTIAGSGGIGENILGGKIEGTGGLGEIEKINEQIKALEEKRIKASIDQLPYINDHLSLLQAQLQTLQQMSDVPAIDLGITMGEVWLPEDITSGNFVVQLDEISNSFEKMKTKVFDLNGAMGTIAESLIDIGANSQGLDEFASAAVGAGKKVIATYIAEGVAAAVKNALVGVPFPFNLVAAGIAGGAAAALFNSMIPSFASGGIVTSPMMAMVGDNPARREAIVPLEKAGQFGFGGGGRETKKTLVHEISGRNLRILLNEEENYLSKVT